MLESAAVAQEFVAQVGRRYQESHPGGGSLPLPDNVRAVQDLYAALCRGDFDAAGRHLTEDVEFDIAGVAPAEFVRQVRGREAMDAVLRQNFAAVEGQRPEAEHVIWQGDMVSIFGRESGRERATGQLYDARWLHVLILRGGLVARVHQYIAHVSYAPAAEPHVA
jgi:ketosteroid isomerase-like protein